MVSHVLAHQLQIILLKASKQFQIDFLLFLLLGFLPSWVSWTLNSLIYHSENI